MIPCTHCGSDCGPKYYSDVPGIGDRGPRKAGDLCLGCHEKWFMEKSKPTVEANFFVIEREPKKKEEEWLTFEGKLK